MRLPLSALVLAVLAASPASAYQVRKSSTGVPLRWADGTVPLVVALDDGPAGTSPAEARAAATEAAAAYRQALADLAPGLGIEVRDAAGAGPARAHDGMSVVRWVKSGWDDDFDPSALAVTVATYDADSGRIIDADVSVNADRYSWSTASDVAGCADAYDLQDVLTHELGHVFGLGHEPGDATATMYPTAGPCETMKRELHRDDLDGLEYLYVQLGPADAGCSLGGRPGGGGAFALALLLLARARRRAALLGVLALAVASTPARATTLVRLPLERLGAAATIVVQGTVRSQAAVARGGRIYTDTVVEVASCGRGACDASVTVRQLGGELGGRGTAIDGTARLLVGDEVLLFLRARRDGAYAPVGMAQGAFRVERGRDGSVAAYVRDLRGVGFAGEERSGAVERVAPGELRRVVP